MAIAYDAQSNVATSGWYNIGTGGSWNHTTGSGSDRVLILAATTNSGDRLTGATYNSVSMTQYQKVSDGGSGYIYIYYLAAPATGTNSLAVTVSPSESYFMAGATSYTGAYQGAPEAYNSGGVNGTTLTISVTTLTDNDWLVGGMLNRSGANLSGGTATTLRGGATNTLKYADSNGAKTPTGSYSLQVTASSSFMNGLIAAIKPASSGTAYTATTSQTLSLSHSKTTQWSARLTATNTSGTSNTRSPAFNAHASPLSYISLSSQATAATTGSSSAITTSQLVLSNVVMVVATEHYVVTASSTLRASNTVSVQAPTDWEFLSRTAGTWTFIPET